MNPDGSAVHIHTAARPVSPKSLVAWVMVGLLCWPVPLLALLGVFAVSTRSQGPRRFGLRMAARIFAILAMASMIANNAGVLSTPIPGVGFGLLTWPLLWGHLLTTTRSGSRIRQEVLVVGALISTLLLLPILTLGVAEARLVGAVSALAGLAVTFPALLWVMDRFWGASSATPDEVASSLRRRCLELGFTEAPWSDGLWLLGHRRGRRTEVRLETRLAPCQVSVAAFLPEWPDGAVARVRREGETGGVALSDPLLARLLIVEGLPDADYILSGLHEPLLSILHAWPDSEIRDGRIRVVLPGPPFAPDQAEETRQTPRWMGVFVLEQLTAAVDLADLLAPRLAPQFPRSITEEVLAPWRDKQTT
ncbi:MAG: hypothetical protein ACI8RZ_004781 [Myxococcota bacterium]|jgi:hypothetical protein